MTVYIEKPAVNLREELASLRNQGGYQEQQFYFDSLVTNGTFDTDTSGWSTSGSGSGTWAVTSGELGCTGQTSNSNYLSQPLSNLTVGSLYKLTVEVVTEGTNNARVGIGNNPTDTFIGDAWNDGDGDGVFVLYWTATATTHYAVFSEGTSGTSHTWDNISVFEVDANNDVVHRMPKGWKPKDVFEDGLLQREGSAHDYEVVYDGFDYYVKPTVAPSATTQTCVIGVKA